MKVYKFKQLLYIATLLLILVSCGKAKKEEAKEEVLPDNIMEMRDDQIKLAKIELGKVEMRSLSATIKVNGLVSVAPQNLATVCMPMGGFVRSTSLMPGKPIQKGQVLAVIENQEFIDIQQKYLEAKNKLEYAQAEYKRHKELYKEDVYSQKNLQQVTTEFHNQKAEVKALEQKLSLIGIQPTKLNEDNISKSVALVSPISGYVKTVNVSIGKSVTASDVLFEIVNTDHLFLELTLFEKDAEKVSNGQKIRFYINNEAEQHDAVIYQTGRSVNDDKTYKVYANVSSQCKNMLPGMYVNAQIETDSRMLPAVPTEAIVSFEDKNYIFVFEKNKKENGKLMTEYRMIEIQKGVTQNGFTEIKLPAEFNIEAMKVVLKGAYNLLSSKKNAGEMSC